VTCKGGEGGAIYCISIKFLPIFYLGVSSNDHGAVRQKKLKNTDLRVLPFPYAKRTKAKRAALHYIRDITSKMIKN